MSHSSNIKQKEKIMEFYHTATQEDYDALMIELDNQGVVWGIKRDKLTERNFWDVYKENTFLIIKGCSLSYGSLKGKYRERHSEWPLIEYKAKGENMTQEEMKRKLQKNAFDVYVAVETVAARGISKAEADLQEAKSSAKKLIEKIDDYLESLKPEFKVGDYVVEQNGDVISKIVEVINGDFWGSYYKKINNYFSNLGGNILVKDIERHATPEEIAEYETALMFLKHDRKPFELKRGDVVYLKGYDKNI